MSKKVPLMELYPIMAETLSAGGEVAFTPSGISMLPMLHDRTDKVILAARTGDLKKYDLPLYRRDNGQFVLHRVVKVNKDGTYTMCGDNQWYHEKGITNDHIVGVVKAFYRNGKYYRCTDRDYVFYCKFWIFITPVRMVYKRGKNCLRRMYHLIYK